MSGCTTDTFFNGLIKVAQQTAGYRFSIDAVILAAYPKPRPGDRIIDLGTGCGILPLILAYRHPKIRITGIEIQEDLASLARQNVDANDMGDRVEIQREDMKGTPRKLGAGIADMVIGNPPHHKADSGRTNPNSQRAVARHEIRITLREFVHTAAALARTGGKFAAVYPAERSTDILYEMRSRNLEPKRLRMVHSKEGEPARLILLEGVKNGRPGVKIEPPLFIYRKAGVYTDELAQMFAP